MNLQVCFSFIYLVYQLLLHNECATSIHFNWHVCDSTNVAMIYENTGL